jgi:hypothetical protein
MNFFLCLPPAQNVSPQGFRRRSSLELSPWPAWLSRRLRPCAFRERGALNTQRPEPGSALADPLSCWVLLLIVRRLQLQIDLFSLAGAGARREHQPAGPRRASLLLVASSVQTKINCIPDVLVQVLCRPAHAAWCPRLGPVSALAPSPAQTAPILPSRPASTATPRAQQSRSALLCARALVPRPWLVLVAHMLLCSCVQLSRSALLFLLHISHPHAAHPLQGAGRGSGAVAGCRGKRQAAGGSSRRWAGGRHDDGGGHEGTGGRGRWRGGAQGARVGWERGRVRTARASEGA